MGIVVMPEIDFFFRLEVFLNGLVTKSVIVRRDEDVLAATRFERDFDFDLSRLEAREETCLESACLDDNGLLVKGDAQPETERVIAIAARPDAERECLIRVVSCDEVIIKGSRNSVASGLSIESKS